jgi:hypothetical protein
MGTIIESQGHPPPVPPPEDFSQKGPAGIGDLVQGKKREADDRKGPEQHEFNSIGRRFTQINADKYFLFSLS